MKQLKILGFVFLILLVGIIQIKDVESLGPDTHKNITDFILFEKNPDGSFVENGIIAQLIRDNYDACMNGLIYADKYIFDYFSNFVLYQEAHDYNTWDRLINDCAKNDRDRVFGYCGKFHLAEDTISHQNYIPVKIKKTKLPNWAIHAPSELALDGLHITPGTSRIMEGHEEFDALYECASGRPDDGRAERLNRLIGGNKFYQEGYVTQGETLWAKLQKGFFRVLAHTPLVKKDDSVPYVELAKSNARQILRGTNPSGDPSGEQALRNADRNANFFLYPFTFLFLGLLFGISIWRRWIWFPFRK